MLPMPKVRKWHRRERQPRMRMRQAARRQHLLIQAGSHPPRIPHLQGARKTLLLMRQIPGARVLPATAADPLQRLWMLAQTMPLTNQARRCLNAHHPPRQRIPTVRQEHILSRHTGPMMRTARPATRTATSMPTILTRGLTSPARRMTTPSISRRSISTSLRVETLGPYTSPAR